MEAYSEYDYSKPKCWEDFNLLPQQLITYLGIAKHGEELRLNIGKVAHIAGIVKQND